MTSRGSIADGTIPQQARRRLLGVRVLRPGRWIGAVPTSWSDSSRRMAELGPLDLLDRGLREAPAWRPAEDPEDG